MDEGATLGANRSGGLRLKCRERIDNPFALARGEARPTRPLKFVPAEGRVPHDFIGTTNASVHLVSAKLQDVLDEHGFTGWTTFPVMVIDDDGAELPGYAGLAVTGRCGPIDDRLSERITLPPHFGGGPERRGLRGIYFRPDSWDGSDLFAPKDSASVYVVERVKDALAAAGVTNVQFERLSEFERTWRANGTPL
jgi:hypothetical protein